MTSSPAQTPTSSVDRRAALLDQAQESIAYLELDDFTRSELLEAEGRYVNIRCYSDTLELSSTAYETLDEALDSLGEITGGNAPWGLLDLDAEDPKVAFIPIVLTAAAGKPQRLSNVPVPDH